MAAAGFVVMDVPVGGLDHAAGRFPGDAHGMYSCEFLDGGALRQPG
jgi:hypothetical protein